MQVDAGESFSFDAVSANRTAASTWNAPFTLRVSAKRVDFASSPFYWHRQLQLLDASLQDPEMACK